MTGFGCIVFNAPFRNSLKSINQPKGDYDKSLFTLEMPIVLLVPQKYQSTERWLWQIQPQDDYSSKTASLKSINQPKGDYDATSSLKVSPGKTSLKSINQPKGDYDHCVKSTSFTRKHSLKSINQPKGDYDADRKPQSSNHEQNLKSINQPKGDYDISKRLSVSSFSPLFASKVSINRKVIMTRLPTAETSSEAISPSKVSINRKVIMTLP